jgi:type IV pilus assembly protein PilC
MSINLKDLRKNSPNVAPSDGFSLEKILNHDIKFFSSGFSDKKKESFYLELSTLYSAGLDIKSALELIEQESNDKKDSILIRTIKDTLINGASLSEALQQSGQFTPYEYYSVQIGEETGKIHSVLDQLYNYYHVKLKQRRQFIGALSYPVIILITSFGAVAFMLLFIVPMFSDIFKRFGGDLPYLTMLIIKFSVGLKEYFFYVIAFVILIASLIYSSRKKEWFQKMWSKILYRIPFFGSIVYSIQLARFCTSMSLLLGSKVPMMRSLQLVEQMISFYPIRVSLPAIGEAVLNGYPLHQCMSNHNVYNRRMISLIKVGEEVNRLDVFFEKLSKQFGSEVEHRTSLLNTFLEPFMIIFLGFIVGFILLAMYMPMFELSTSIGR